MGKLPVLRAREVCAILESLGFILVRQKGSHMQYRTRTVVARLSRIIPEETYLQSCFVTLPGTLG
jgi:predicted RNA binding protein YcfA (HicA-like mRNA interferase family)